MKTVYAWARDAVGNISDPASFGVEYTLPPCHYVETTVLPTKFQINDSRIIKRGGLTSLTSDDDNFLVIDPYKHDRTAELTVDFKLAEMDVTGLTASVSSRSEWSSSPYERTVLAYNYATLDWEVVEPTRTVGKSSVRSDIVFADIVENISDYLGREGDMLTFSLRILMERSLFFGEHLVDLAQLTVTHPEDPNCVDE
jgi:hypothetical protein